MEYQKNNKTDQVKYLTSSSISGPHEFRDQVHLTDIVISLYFKKKLNKSHIICWKIMLLIRFEPAASWFFYHVLATEV